MLRLGRGCDFGALRFHVDRRSRLQVVVLADDPRTVQMQDMLVPILKAWKVETGGEDLLFKPDRPGRRAGRVTVAPETYATVTPSTFVRPHPLHKHLRQALKARKIPAGS